MSIIRQFSSLCFTCESDVPNYSKRSLILLASLVSVQGLDNTVPGLVTTESCRQIWKICFFSSGVLNTIGLYTLYILKVSELRSMTVPEKFNTLVQKPHQIL